MFQRILVANRGEIALRIIRACKELGVETVAIYSQADREGPWLELADRAYLLESGHVSLHGTAAELVRTDVVRKLYLGA